MVVPPLTVVVPARSRKTVNVNEHVLGAGIRVPLNVSIRVEADRPIVAERPMYFSADPALGATVDGGTTVVGATAASLRHSFAEGTVRPGFVEFVTLQNPNDAPTTAALDFQASDDRGSPVAVPSLAVSLAGASRATVNVNQHLASRGVPTPVNVSIRVEADRPIVAERPMYFSADPALGATVDGGTTVVG